MVTHGLIIIILDLAMEAVSLQERLQLIQQQQRERFITRKSLKVKEDYVCPDIQGESIPASHGQGGVDSDVEADLELRTATQEDNTKVKSNKTDLSVPVSSYVKELEYLKSCVEQLQSDNARLKSELKQKEQKIIELEKEHEEERVAMGKAGATVTQRIVELSKRNRELNAEVAAEKNRIRQYQKKLKESEMTTSQKESQGQPSGYKDLHKHKGDAALKLQKEDQATVIAQLQVQLQQSKLRMAEQRNQCQVLKQELKLAQRVITKEVGEGVNTSTLLSGTSGWRGRAQQIITLQSKLAELGDQLRNGRQNGSTRVRRAVSSEHREHTASAPMVDPRQKATLRKIESDKQRNLDEARSELESLKAEYSNVQQQCSALKARNKTLTNHVKSMKEEIASLQAQVDKAKLMEIPRSKSANSNDFDTVFQDMEREIQQLSKDNQVLRKQLIRCQTEIQALKAGMKESNPSTLPPVTSRGRRRGELERKAASAGQPTGPLHTLSHISLMSQVSKIEQDRLLELTRCLQQRLDATTDKFNSLDIEMRTLRQQNVRLEKIVGRGRAKDGYDGSQRTRALCEVQELEAQLAIQMDVNAVLKDTLELTRQEKMEDLKLYWKMVQETKKLLLRDDLEN